MAKVTVRFIGIVLSVAMLIGGWTYLERPSISVVRSQFLGATQAQNGSGMTNAVDLKRLPIGDGRISTQPKMGSVWPCRTQFNHRAGAHASGDWIQADGTYNLTAKPTVDGAVSWPSQFKVALQQNIRTITGNRLPSTVTGQFPVSPKDDAYHYDRNPNSITSEDFQLNLPALPQRAKEASCLPMGAIGVLRNGGYFFNAVDERGKDAVAHEIQDSCQGHPERHGAYHYHSVTSCLDDKGKGHSALVGYAFDGFGIYGHRGEKGQELTNADLDACHGHTHAVEWGGKTVKFYHYHATWEYPYTLGCFRGTPTDFQG
jgi:hypothetical protein